mmetsp:Transcript_37617/g.55090  ORF Transcript_37617/g.55090 Transcript_37617/m.55090 type:complete len:80 (+) Transcript_37617:95-334(+)
MKQYLIVCTDGNTLINMPKLLIREPFFCEKEEGRQQNHCFRCAQIFTGCAFPKTFLCHLVKHFSMVFLPRAALQSIHEE